MILLRPIKTDFITQGFGENKNPFYAKAGILGHNGIDFLAEEGEPIYWYGKDVEGTVVRTYDDVNGGFAIDVLTKDIEGMFIHRFFHLKGFACQPGQVLSTADLIGYADNTGNSTGTHLHALDIKEVEKDELGNYKVKNYDNGYHGSLNPSKWFQNVYVKEYMDQMKAKLTLIQQLIEVLKLLISLRITHK